MQVSAQMQAYQTNAMQTMQQHGKTFALAAKLLSKASRQDAATLYAFARAVDDSVDLQATNQQAKAQIDAITQALNTQNAAFGDIKQLINRHHIKPQVMQAFLHAQKTDEDGRQIATENELIDYAYGVAGSIGQMMRPILGAPQSAEIYAVSLGLAMQLTNIARDVVEDANRSRIYVPASFFVQALTPANLTQPTQTQQAFIFAAIAQLLTLADTYYHFAAIGFAQIPLRNRLAIAAASAMYRAIGRKILARGAANYWRGRVSLGLLEKLPIAFKAVLKTLHTTLLPNKQAHADLAIENTIKSVLNQKYTNKTHAKQ